MKSNVFQNVDIQKPFKDFDSLIRFFSDETLRVLDRITQNEVTIKDLTQQIQESDFLGKILGWLVLIQLKNNKEADQIFEEHLKQMILFQDIEQLSIFLVALSTDKKLECILSKSMEYFETYLKERIKYEIFLIETYISKPSEKEQVNSDLNEWIECTNKGLNYFKEGELDKSLDCINKVLKTIPLITQHPIDNLMNLFISGFILLEKNKPLEALEKLQKVYDINNRIINIYSYKSLCYFKVHEMELYLENLKKSFNDEDLKLIYYKFHADFLLYRKDYVKAIGFCNKIVELSDVGSRKLLQEYFDAEIFQIVRALINDNQHSECFQFLKKVDHFYVEDIGSDNFELVLEMLEYYEENKCFEEYYEMLKKISIFDYVDFEEDFNTGVMKKMLDEIRNGKDNFTREKNQLIKMHKKEIIESKEEERSKIISNLSHSIKNLISTIIDPLTNLKEEQQYKDVVIDNALKGADLIREIVNAMNLSFKGSIADFRYDAQHNRGNDSLSLYNIIFESLRHSVSNMFDSKYFGNFMRNYFPDKEIYHKAKLLWNEIQNDGDLESFINRYMFKINLKINDAQELVIGNEKGSAIKFQILLQETILNAVKYTSFVDKDKREVNITCSKNKTKINFEVSNTFKHGEMTKTTGLGKIIIENFCKLLGTEPDVIKKESSYMLSIRFNNIWSNNGK